MALEDDPDFDDSAGDLLTVKTLIARAATHNPFSSQENFLFLIMKLILGIFDQIYFSVGKKFFC